MQCGSDQCAKWLGGGRQLPDADGTLTKRPGRTSRLTRNKLDSWYGRRRSSLVPTNESVPSFLRGRRFLRAARTAWPGVVVVGSQSTTRPLAGPDRSIARGRIAPWQNFCLSTLASLSCCRHVSEDNPREAAFPVLDAWSGRRLVPFCKYSSPERELRELRELPPE